MSAPTPADAQPEDRGLQPPAFGRPSPALVARAARGYACFPAARAPDAATRRPRPRGRRGGTAVSGTHAVLHDPLGLIEAELRLDRGPHEALVTAVLETAAPRPGRDPSGCSAH